MTTPKLLIVEDDEAIQTQLKLVSVPVALARNLGFSATELRRVQRLVEEHEPRLLEAWHEYFRG